MPEDLSKQRDPSSQPSLDQLLYDLEVMYDKRAEQAKNESAVTKPKGVYYMHVTHQCNASYRNGARGDSMHFRIYGQMFMKK